MKGDEKSWYPEVTVATLVERAGRFLFVEEQIEGELLFNQPAGHLEDGESLIAAAVRETLEETGWEVEVEALCGFYLYRSARRGTTILRSAFIAKPLRHHPDRLLDDGIVRACWMTRAEVIATGRARSPFVVRCLDDYLAGRRHPLDLIAHIAV